MVDILTAAMGAKMASGAVQSQIDTALTSVYKYKGQCTNSQLASKTKTAGDVWEITDAGTYAAGTDVVCDGTNWSAMSGHLHVNVVDSLESTSQQDALSANMGKALATGKQDALTAGTGITINNNVISASGGGIKCVEQSKENYAKFFQVISGGRCDVLHDCIMTDDLGNVLFMLFKGQNTQPGGMPIVHNELGEGGTYNYVIHGGYIKYKEYCIEQYMDFTGIRCKTYKISATTTEESGTYTTTFSLNSPSKTNYTSGKIYYWDDIDFSS